MSYRYQRRHEAGLYLSSQNMRMEDTGQLGITFVESSLCGQSKAEDVLLSVQLREMIE